MSVFHGQQHPGAMRLHRQAKREQAQERQDRHDLFKRDAVANVPDEIVLDTPEFDRSNRGGSFGHPFAYCETCHKRGFFSRKVARKAIRHWHPGDQRMRPYACPVDGSVLWHIGHMPAIVKTRGLIATDDLLAQSYRQPKRDAS